MGQQEFPIIRRIEGSHPTVEHLEGVDACLHLRDEVFAASLFDGLSTGGRTVVVHLAPLVPVADVAYGHQPAPLVEALDIATRGTYVLYKAAIAAGVGEAVQASSLSSMDAYADDLEVTEQWRPRPAPTAQDLAPHLCEMVGIEFTRDPLVERPLAITCVRFATIIDDVSEGEAPVPVDGRSMRVEDAAAAVIRAIAVRGDVGDPNAAQQLIETVYQLVSRNDEETRRFLDDVIVLAADLALRSPTFAARVGESRNMGAMRSFENASPIGVTFGWIAKIGPGSQSIT